MNTTSHGLTDDEIFAVTSPQDSLGGPYAIVYKDQIRRWAVVAIDWNENHALGIRWFWEKKGHPISTGYPVWFVVPSELGEAVLAGLPISHDFRDEINQFLCGRLSGADLRVKRGRAAAQ